MNLNQRIAAELANLKGSSDTASVWGLEILSEDLKRDIIADESEKAEHDNECWHDYVTGTFAAGGLWLGFAQWAKGREVASPDNVAYMLDNDGDLPVYEVTVGGVVYRYDHESVFMSVAEDPDEQEHFWFFHRLNGPTAEQVADLIAKAKGDK